MKKDIMTRIRTTRDIVVIIPNGTHTIQRGTYFYTEECEETVTNCGVAIRVPGRGNADAWLFIDEDIEFVQIPSPIGGIDGLIPI
jgi:hypothetical protein